MKKPCESHIKELRKVSLKLRWGLTMTGSTLILSDENHNRLEVAEMHLANAIKELNQIE